MKKFSYSFLAFSLSCFSIPLYLHLASFYFNKFGLSVAIVGLVIFFCRLLDCVFDPLSGYISDFLIGKKIPRTRIILFGSVPLFFSFYLIFNPSYTEPNQILIWLTANLILLYASLSLVTVNYEALVSSFGEEVNKFIAAREFMQILGILVISILPSIISQQLSVSYDDSFGFLAFFVVPVFFVGVILLNYSFGKIIAATKIIIAFPKNREFWKLALIYLLNSIAVAIPAVLIRFYVDFHLQATHLNGAFLGLYFLTAAASVFIWVKIIDKIGQKKSWIISILFSVAIFAFAGFITSQNYYLFYIICFLSGFAVGCDLTVPQSILVKIIKDDENKTIYFSIFSMITKISIAFASVLSLGLVSNSDGSLNYEAIPITYALVPCLFKLITVFLLRKL